MLLNNIFLQNFRNYQKTTFNFDKDITVIVGPNTIGKTNILEAIFLLSTGKSFRAEKDMEMIRFGEEIANVKCEMRNEKWEERSEKLEIILTTGEVGGELAPRKKYLVNGVSKRQMDFVGNLRCVLFSPTDLELVTDSPSLRRKYLDFVLTQVDREYRRALLTYEKGLRQRNKLLERIREEGASSGQLTFWNELLIKNGQVITLKRQEFINFVNHPGLLRPDLNASRSGLTGLNFHLVYDQSEISQDRLIKYQKEEIASSQTLVGPHRDDFKFQIIDTSSRDISLFGSRGEQRMAILWLKLNELEFVAEKSSDSSTGSGLGRPILLLDDIFSELDEKHRKLILEVIPKQQTIITTTDLHHIEKEYLEKMQIIELTG